MRGRGHMLALPRDLLYTFHWRPPCQQEHMLNSPPGSGVEHETLCVGEPDPRDNTGRLCHFHSLLM